MKPRLISIIAAAAMLAVPTASALGAQSGQQAQAEGDIVHVKQLAGWSGSDIEFATREVTKLSNGATGTPVCKVPGQNPCAEFEKETRDFAVAGALGGFARVVDITDPTNPVVVGLSPCSMSQNDIQIQGDLLFTAQDPGTASCKKPTGGNQTGVSSAIIDFSDPRNPKFLARIQNARSVHNHTAHPTKPYLYLSDSNLAHQGLGDIPIWDISNPSVPVLKTTFELGAHSPHDITFNADGSRAYVAAVSLTYILDTTNPIAPTVVSIIPNEGISISHNADPTPDGNYLLVADEVGGGAAGLSPGGPVHVYDITVEQRPVKVGVIWNDCLPNTCFALTELLPNPTAHVTRINPDGYTMAVAWYKDGVHVMDFSSIRGANAAGSGAATGIGARTIGRIRMPGANTWSAKMYQERLPGYVFANDISRGLDVFYVASMGPGFLARGTIHGGHNGNFAAGVGVTRVEFETECRYSPRTNGVDGWVTKIPADKADGNYTLTAKAVSSAGGPFDLDLYFYDKDCVLLEAHAPADTDTTGQIPEGTAYAMTTNYEPNANLVLRLSTAYAPPPPPEE